MNNTEIKTVELIVNSEQARKKLEELSTKLEQLKVKRDNALNKGDSRGLAVYTREIKKLENEIGRTATRAETMSRALSNLDKSTPNELKRTLRELNKELNSGKVRRGSDEWNVLTKAIRETKDALSAVNDELRTIEGDSWTDRLAEWGNKWMGLVQNVEAGIDMLTSLRQTLQATVSDYADMEEAMAQVRKYTGLSSEDVSSLNEELKAMDTRTSREQLNALAGDAGKLGITAKDNIMEFVDAADKINVALGDDLGAGAVKNVGKLAMLFGEDERLGLKAAMLSTASVINELSQNSSAAAGYLEEFTARVAGVGKQAGLTQAQIMGFAAVLDENMQQDETSATAFSQLITKMYQEPAKFAALAGKDLQEFTRLLKEDANGALLAFFNAMQSRGGFDKLAPMFSEMGLDGTRATAVLTSIADKLGNVEKMQRLANTAYAEAVSIDNEFSVQNTTVQASLDKARKAALDMRIELGEKLQPAAAHMLNLTTTFLRSLSSLIDFCVKYRKTIVAVTAAILVYTAVTKAQIAWETLHNLQIKSKVASLALLIKSTTLYKTAVQALALVQGLCTVAVTLFTQGIVAARLQFTLLTVAMMKNPLGLIAVLLSTAIGLILQFTNVLGLDTEEELRNTKALEGRAKAIEECGEAEKSAAAKVEEEANRIKTLQKIIHDNTRSIKERRAAIIELQNIVPGYEASLTNEGKLTEKNTNKIKDYLVQLKKKALAEALYDKLKDAMAKKADADLAKDAWDKAVKMREENAKKPEYQSRTKKKWGYTWKGGLRKYDAETNPLYTENNDKLFYNLGRQRFWENEQKNAQDAIDTILDYAKKQGADKQLENLIGSGGNSTSSVSSSTSTSTGSASGGGKGDKTGTKKDPIEEKRKEYEKEQLAQKLYQTLLYQQGEISRQEYEQKLLAIEEASIVKQRDLYKQGSDEWNKLEEKRLDLMQRIKENAAEWSIHQIEVEEADERQKAQEAYLNGTLSEEAYQQKLDEIKLTHLRKRASYYKGVGDTEHYETANAAAEQEDFSQQLARRKAYLEKAKALQQEYFKKSLDERKADELALLDELVKAAVISEEDKQKYLLEIEEKYKKLKKEEEDKEKDKGRKDSPLGDASGWAGDFINIAKALENLQKKLADGEASWEDYAAVAVASLTLVSSIIGSVSSMYQAQQQAEEQAVTDRYDKEIDKVGENSKKGKKLEEQKQKELAKIKNKYNKREQAMEIAQAVASTAMAAINAYASASKISWILGPIAAAMALAAGAIQIAAIKKQHAAQAEGYYSGGFTGGRDYRKEAGVVHEGEFVASHLAVNNPNVAPVLRLIDHAQRNNTVASLTAADVSRSLPAYSSSVASPSVGSAAAPSVQVVDTSSPRVVEVMERLNQNLEAGIRASVSIVGQDGLDRQWARYNKMKNRG